MIDSFSSGSSFLKRVEWKQKSKENGKMNVLFAQEEKANGTATIPRSRREAGRLCLLNSLFGNADYLNALQASVRRDFLWSALFWWQAPFLAALS